MADTSSPVELLQALIRLDTSNPPGNERACLEYVAGLLAEAGVEHRFVASDPERPNLVARVPGRGDAPPLLLYGHVDVVPADPLDWAHPPFGGDVIDGEVWGRGALDMKGGVAIMLAALLAAARWQTPPAGDLVLMLTSDEEAGSLPGMKFLVEEHPELFAGVRFGISEFGGFTQWHGSHRFTPIQVAEKQRCLIRATIRGKGGHAASVVRGTASGKAGRLLQALATRRLPVHVTPVARQMIEAMAGALPLHERAGLRALLVPALTDRLLDLIGEGGAPLDPLLHNTATPTVLAGGQVTNVIPTEITIDLDGRVLPGSSPRALVAELEALAPGLAEYEIVREEPPAAAQPDMALFPLLEQVNRGKDPGATPIPMLLSGYTDARYVSQLGIQTYGYLPMKLPRHITTTLVHAADERVTVEGLEFGVDCLAEVLRRYGPEP